MKALFKPFLVNEPHRDPALYIDLFGKKESFLIDLGDISALSTRKILRISRIFISHTHIDHFFGFDAILRTCLSKKEPVHIYGPKNIIKNVSGKLSGYTWNLIKEYPISIYVHEFYRNSLKTCFFSAKNNLKKTLVETKGVMDGILYEDHELRIKALVLDHKIPVLSFLLEEKKKLNVRKEVLAELDLTPGPWLNNLKQMTLLNTIPSEITVPCGGTTKIFDGNELVEKLMLIKEGEKILYVTDVCYSKRDAGKIKKFAKAPDILFCEAFFTSEDEKRAGERYHLTATQTRLIADGIGAKKLVIFHFSPRYKGNFKRIYKEAFAGNRD
jgi:ribonuclease Z